MGRKSWITTDHPERALLGGESGATAVEYGVIISLIAVGLITIIPFLENAAKLIFNAIAMLIAGFGAASI